MQFNMRPQLGRVDVTEAGKLPATGVVTTTLRTPTSTLITMQRERNHAMTLQRTIVACFLLSSSSLWAADHPHPHPPAGPEDNGLCRRLLVTKLKDQHEGHHVQLEVINVGKDRITLAGRLYYENDKLW